MLRWFRRDRQSPAKSTSAERLAQTLIELLEAMPQSTRIETGRRLVVLYKLFIEEFHGVDAYLALEDEERQAYHAKLLAAADRARSSGRPGSDAAWQACMMFACFLLVHRSDAYAGTTGVAFANLVTSLIDSSR
jgi:hypothetical protein